MDIIWEIVTRYECQLGEKLSQNETLGEEELVQILSNSGTEINESASRVPAQVLRTLNGNYFAAGWDVKMKQKIHIAPLSAEKVHDLFLNSLRYLSTWEDQITPTLAELEDISKATTKLWNLDVNRLQPGVDYQINLQMGKNPYEEGDRAECPLFTFVNENVFQRPTFASFCALLDNYERNVGTSEVVTVEELKEDRTFLEIILRTPVMKYCHRYLVAKNLASQNEEDFIQQLNQLWFSLYGRKCANDSSGFEHVFVGEIKAEKVTGLHNWVRIYQEERANHLNYLGYVKPRSRGCKVLEPHENEQLITIQFEWFGDLKPVGSSFIGVSPEFEIALYTLLFLLGENRVTVKVGPYSVQINSFPFNRDGLVYIGTAFPSTPPLTEDQAAAKIQAVVRGRQARKSDPVEHIKQKERKKKKHQAATKIQSCFRGNYFRQKKYVKKNNQS